MLCYGRSEAVKHLIGGILSPLYTKKVPEETFFDTPLSFARQTRFRTLVQKQWYKSPAELDFDKELHLPRARGRHETCLVRLGTYGSLALPLLWEREGAKSRLVGDWL